MRTLLFIILLLIFVQEVSSRGGPGSPWTRRGYHGMNSRRNINPPVYLKMRTSLISELKEPINPLKVFTIFILIIGLIFLFCLHRITDTLEKIVKLNSKEKILELKEDIKER